jgi:hypothetical protein
MIVRRRKTQNLVKSFLFVHKNACGRALPRNDNISPQFARATLGASPAWRFLLVTEEKNGHLFADVYEDGLSFCVIARAASI